MRNSLRRRTTCCVPKVGCRRPFQSQTGQVDSSIHQKEKDGHHAGDGVQFTGKQHHLVEQTRHTSGLPHSFMKLSKKTKKKQLG